MPGPAAETPQGEACCPDHGLTTALLLSAAQRNKDTHCCAPGNRATGRAEVSRLKEGLQAGRACLVERAS
ncbi:hypothetical protein NDU88_003593 [Pleurodeles waltl]|uniref:Uncharacterized protein n=1 Tax=Pleurodeles waltl TaxID=8319 RepID=A0AAV7SGD0_PLEWA|nr:hypothetical protein NDU88_003593 [Pleurodeles waltl]